ncbi:MAG: HEAT repeat domain-containing protein [Phaeodactylibacter sp.]|nr:HEAT repeat domain-containing protein [Phaeodactylibacter sp.]
MLCTPNYKTDSTIYLEQGESAPLESIIQAADYATYKPEVDSIMVLLQSRCSAVRFWGVAGVLHLGPQASAELMPMLKQLLNDDSGDIQSLAAEAMHKAGHKQIAIDVFKALLAHDNPYVVLRALNSLESLGDLPSELRSSVEALLKSPIIKELSYIEWKAAALLGVEVIENT